jgi:HEAT repeat protein
MGVRRDVLGELGVIIKPQFKLRRLLWAIAILAIALGIGRYPYFYIQSNARFQSRSQEAITLISSYRSNRPPELVDADWQAAIDVVQEAWAKTIPGRESIADGELEDILSRMRWLADRSSATRAEGDLYGIMDLLGHFPSRVPSTNFLYSMRSALKERLHGKTGTSTSVIDYARMVVGERSADAFADLSAGLKHAEWQTRAMACRALKELGLTGRLDEAIEVEVRALQDDDALVRQIALESLGELGPDAVAAFPAIDDLLRRDPSSQVRVAAGRVLAQLDPPGKLAVPLLAAVLRDPDCGLRIALIRELDGFGPKGAAAAQALIEVIEHDEDHSVRREAVRCLSRVSSASIAVPTLLGALGSEQIRKDVPVAGSILQALGQIGPAAVSAIPMLVETYNTAPNEHVRGSAMIALGGIGPSARTAVPMILKATKDPHCFVRGLALEALIKIEVEPDVVIPPLISALRDKQSAVQRTAAVNLGQLGPSAKAAVPALEAAIADRSFAERPAAASALRLIQGE